MKVMAARNPEGAMFARTHIACRRPPNMSNPAALFPVPEHGLEDGARASATRCDTKV